MSKIVIADSSCLIGLSKIEQLDILPLKKIGDRTRFRHFPLTQTTKIACR